MKSPPAAKNAGLSMIPALYAGSCTASDTVDMDPSARGIYIGGGGNVRVLMLGYSSASADKAVTFSSCAAGTVLPFQIRRVFSSGTTATGLIKLW